MRDDKGKFVPKLCSTEQEIPSDPPSEKKEKKEENNLQNLFNQPLTLKGMLVLIILIWLVLTHGKDALSPINDKVRDFVSYQYCGNYTGSQEPVASSTPKRKEG
jgi:hypothetical protein